MINSLIRAMIITIMTAMAYSPDAYIIVPNPSIPPTPTSERQRRIITPEPTTEATPTPTPIDTPEPTPISTPVETPIITETPAPTEEPTPEPTEDPWTCPAVGDCTKKEYRDLCKSSCEATGQNGCAGICNQCWKEGS